MPRYSRIVAAFALLIFAQTAWSYPLRCNKAQVICEIKSKRLTVGDYIGVFDDNRTLIAIGRVKDIKDLARIVEISKKYATITRSHSAERIEDREAKNPKKYFTLKRSLDDRLWSGSLALLSMGIGDGFVGYEAMGSYGKLWTGDIYYTLSASYITASGEASENLKSIGSQDVDLSVITLGGGLSMSLLNEEAFSAQAGFELGLAHVTADISGGFDANELLNERVTNGGGLMFRAGGRIYGHPGQYKPYFGVQFVGIHSSTSVGFLLGLALVL